MRHKFYSRRLEITCKLNVTSDFGCILLQCLSSNEINNKLHLDISLDTAMAVLSANRVILLHVSKHTAPIYTLLNRVLVLSQFRYYRCK